MDHSPRDRFAQAHVETTRRWLLQCGGAGLVGALWSPAVARGDEFDPRLLKLVEGQSYLTPSGDFRNVERHPPFPYQLPLKERRAHGLERVTWKLEVLPDPESNSRLRSELSVKEGTAVTFSDLMKMADRSAVRYLKVMTCNNLAEPLGMGLWEGVPLRDVIWKAKPDKNVRRVFYHGWYDGNPKHLFQSSLPIGRVLEDPPGVQPVILCYKLNGRWLTGERGGPVRIIVPEAYGFKSIKWVQRVYLTNNHHANDTYADANNDVESPLKTYAQTLRWPEEVKVGDPIPVTGVAQCGSSGLSKVQVWIKPADQSDPAGDRYFAKAPWADAQVLPPPEKWGEMLPDGKLPDVPSQFGDDGKPKQWPLRDTLAHWAAILPGLPAGKYDLRCRTIDANGVAQPMPRPFQKSGANAIQRVSITVRS